jgi:hypothetical protein
MKYKAYLKSNALLRESCCDEAIKHMVVLVIAWTYTEIYSVVPSQYTKFVQYNTSIIWFLKNFKGFEVVFLVHKKIQLKDAANQRLSKDFHPRQSRIPSQAVHLTVFDCLLLGPPVP